MDFLTTRLTHEVAIKSLFIHELGKGTPEDIKMDCVICFKSIDPEVIRNLMGSMHTYFVVFLGKCTH